MKIAKTQSKEPIFNGEAWITKKDHGIELREKRSAGADKRYSITLVEVTKLEFLQMFKATLLGKKSNRLKRFTVNCLAWALNKVI